MVIEWPIDALHTHFLQTQPVQNCVQLSLELSFKNYSNAIFVRTQLQLCCWGKNTWYCIIRGYRFHFNRRHAHVLWQSGRKFKAAVQIFFPPPPDSKAKVQFHTRRNKSKDQFSNVVLYAFDFLGVFCSSDDATQPWKKKIDSPSDVGQAKKVHRLLLLTGPSFGRMGKKWNFFSSRSAATFIRICSMMAKKFPSITHGCCVVCPTKPTQHHITYITLRRHLALVLWVKKENERKSRFNSFPTT